MAIRLGSRPHGIVVNGKKFKKKAWTITDTLAYIDGRSGEYDKIEEMCMDDAYVKGWNAKRDGTTLKQAIADIGASRFASKSYKADRERLIRKGYRDYTPISQADLERYAQFKIEKLLRGQE